MLSVVYCSFFSVLLMTVFFVYFLKFFIPGLIFGIPWSHPLSASLNHCSMFPLYLHGPPCSVHSFICTAAVIGQTASIYASNQHTVVARLLVALTLLYLAYWFTMSCRRTHLVLRTTMQPAIDSGWRNMSSYAFSWFIHVLGQQLKSEASFAKQNTAL